MKSIRGVAGVVGRRSERLLVAALVTQISIVREGAALTRALVLGDVVPASARQRMSKIEHRGDAERQRVVASLAHALASPIDREDLFRVSRSIDDILDNLRDFVREFDLFGLEEEPLLAPVIDALDLALHDLSTAVEAIRTDPRRIRSAALTAKKNGLRPAYQLAMAEILKREVDSRVLMSRELLRRLDVVGLCLRDAANALSDGAMKRSH